MFVVYNYFLFLSRLEYKNGVKTASSRQYIKIKIPLRRNDRAGFGYCPIIS